MSWIRENTLNWYQHLAVRVLKSGHVPKHIAIIMDGNRRYANKSKVKKVEGHSKGFEKLAETLQWCADLGILEVSVYAFSIENFKRTKEEVDELMELAKQKFQRLLDEKDKLMVHGVCIRVIGNFSLIPPDVRRLIAQAMRITKHNNKAFLNVFFAYTSRDEMSHAIKDVIKGVRTNDIMPDDIDADLISKCLYTYNLPEPDLLIRTSGEVRFSDFLLWQITNTCIYFADVLWPEFTIWDLLSAVFYYQRCYSGLQQPIKMQELMSAMNNTRTTTFINKLYHERQAMLNEMCLPEVESQ